MTNHAKLLAIRWSARVLGTAMLLLVTFIAIGEGGPPNPWAQPWRVNLELHLMLAIWLGLLLAWKWEALGGVLVVGGVIAFCLLEGRPPNGVFLMMLIASVAYLCAWIMDRREEKVG